MKKRTKLFLITILLVFSVFSFTNNSPLVGVNDQVTVQYSGVVENHVFNTMIVTFQVGKEEVIKGLDQGVIGMRLGEEKNITIPPALAFGEYNLSLIKEISNEFFIKLNETIPEQGEVLNIDGVRGRVIDVTNETILFDTNHELAGKTLNLTLKLLAHSKA